MADPDMPGAGGDAPEVELIRQPHGGALMPAWPKGTNGAANGPGKGMAASGSGWRKARREALEKLREATPENVEKLIKLGKSEDDRVALMANIHMLDRALGKPTDNPQGDADGGGSIDLSGLSDADKARLADALATIYELTGRGPGGLVG